MSHPSLPTVGDQFGRYRIDGQIGFGGMGTVLAATDTQLGRKVALKVISPQLAASEEFRTRFEREASLMTRMDSPHVLTVYDHGVHEGTPWLATPYVAGGDLGGLLRARGPMPLPIAATVCAQIASALRDAHAVGIIHRDVKPANVLLQASDDEPFTYLCDFGIAHTGDSGLTQAGSVAGSWAYIAPERIKGGPGTPQTDIYALGCLFWACLTGDAPYSGSDMEVGLAHAEAPVPRFAGDDPVTLRVNEVLAKALAKDPGDRYATAADLRKDLAGLAARPDAAAFRPEAPAAGAASPQRHAAPTEVRQTTGQRRSRRLVGTAAALALVAGAAGASWWALSRDDAPASADPHPGPVAGSGIAGDLDGDEYGDVAVSRVDDDLEVDAISVLGSTGKAFGSPSEVETEKGTPHLAHADGDGRPDTVWVQRPGSMDDAFEVTVVPTTDEPRKHTIGFDPAFFLLSPSVTLADVTGDGLDDLLLHGDVDDRVTIHVAPAADDGFGEVEHWYSGPRASAVSPYLVPVQLDGTGASELYLVRSPETGVKEYVLLTAGEGELVEGPTSTIRGAAWGLGAHLFGDVDGDGDLEVMVPGARGAAIGVFDITDGSIARKPTTWWSTEVPREEWMERVISYDESRWTLSDVDGDGDADLVNLLEADGDSIPVQVHLSEDGSLTDPVAWGSLSCGSDCADRHVFL